MTISLNLPSPYLLHNNAPTWLNATLPTRINHLATRWSLTIAPPFPDLTFNYVAPAARVDGSPCVLKISRHLDDTRNEIAALRFWNGDGAAQLLEADPDLGALLIERLHPGTMLTTLAENDDDAATLIASRILRQLWRPASGTDGLRSLQSWTDAYDRNRDALVQGSAGFPAGLFQRADSLRRDLLTTPEPTAILHGDLHHFNILQAQRADWLAIDPKGLVGDRSFDVCQFLRNPHPVPESVNRRRLDILCAELSLDRQRTKDWCVVHAILDAIWSFEDGTPWQPQVQYAEQTLSF